MRVTQRRSVPWQRGSLAQLSVAHSISRHRCPRLPAACRALRSPPPPTAPTTTSELLQEGGCFGGAGIVMLAGHSIWPIGTE